MHVPDPLRQIEACFNARSARATPWPGNTYRQQLGFRYCCRGLSRLSHDASLMWYYDTAIVLLGCVHAVSR